MSLGFDSASTERTGRVHRGAAATRVLVVDDDSLERAATCDALTDEPDLVVVDAVATGDAPAAVSRSLPDVVVLDGDLRRPPTQRVLAMLRTASARVRVLVLADVADPAALLETLSAGGSGYLLKARGRARLARSIHEVMEGRMPLDQDLVAATRERLERPAPVAPATAGDGDGRHPLTTRELTVLGLVALGMTNEQIARELVLSPGTVKLHVQHIIAKLEVANRTQAAVYAAQHGLLPAR